METTKTNSGFYQKYLTLALLILISCFTLFYLDKDIKTINQLFDHRILIPLVIYFTPTFLISFFLFRMFYKKNETMMSFILSLCIGLPAGFTLVIVILKILMH